MRESLAEVDRLLREWSEGDKTALEKLIPLVEPELRRLAHAVLLRQAPEHDLQTTALINETFVRILEKPKRDRHGHKHFYAIAALIMRKVLIDFTRSQLRNKRQGEASRTDLENLADLSDESSQKKAIELLAMDEALNRLKELDPRKAQIVDLKYFGGLNIGEIAEVLEISVGSVKREWGLARSYIRREMVILVPAQVDKLTITKESEVTFVLTDNDKKKLSEAWSNRELVATLMTENWSGLKLLVHIRTAPNLTESQLLFVSGIKAAMARLLLLKLEELGALKSDHEQFNLTKTAAVLLENLQKATGNNFQSE